MALTVMDLASRLKSYVSSILKVSASHRRERHIIQAPKPLLPSYGAGAARTFLQDIAMLVLLNSQERTLDQIKEIG